MDQSNIRESKIGDRSKLGVSYNIIDEVCQTESKTSLEKKLLVTIVKHLSS
jgi:hypothetical protein